MPGLVLGLKLNFAKAKRSYSNMYFKQKVENLCTVVENPSPEAKNSSPGTNFLSRNKKIEFAKNLIEQKIRLWQKKILRRNFFEKRRRRRRNPFFVATRRRWRRSRQRRVDARNAVCKKRQRRRRSHFLLLSIKTNFWLI